MVRVARMAAAERVRHLAERLVEMLAHHVLVGQVGRHLAHPVHVVGKGDEAARPVHHLREGVPHHQRPRHLLERAEVRESRGTVAGLEDDLPLLRPVRIALQQLARLLVRPGLGDERGGPELFCDGQ